MHKQQRPAVQAVVLLRGDGSVAADLTHGVFSLVALAYSNSGLLAGNSVDVGVALDVGAALDGANGVLGNVAFTHGNCCLLTCSGVDVGVALDVDATRSGLGATRGGLHTGLSEGNSGNGGKNGSNDDFTHDMTLPF